MNKNSETFFFAEVKEIFKKLDTSKSGTITKSEFYKNIKTLNLNLSEEVINKIFTLADTKNDNQLSYQELSKYINSKDTYLKNLFNFIDSKKSGYLDKTELKNSFKYFNYKITNTELENLIQKFSIKNKNFITYQDFIKFHHQYPIENIRNFFDKFISEPIDIGESVQIVGHGKLSNLVVLVSYVFGGIISRTVTAPFDRVKIQMQAKTELKGVFQTFRYVRREGGWKSFFQGNGTNICKLIPDTLIRYFVYHFIVDKFFENDVRFFQKFAVSAAACMVSSCFIYPLEICKTRLSLTGKEIYNGTFHCISKIVEKEG